MGACSTCGNDYDKTFAVETADGTHLTFDSIECAAHLIAPACAHCDCRILGHGIEASGTIYCCANCAQHSGVEGAQDRVAT
ncbi:hypothetical protein [Nocardioides sp. BYT-33-1]|uniref:hypothetical protein n=1 Tax=Nocardioides sp. BYT-33-1 TaxID=3416952 RepID=UPI003F5319F5